MGAGRWSRIDFDTFFVLDNWRPKNFEEYPDADTTALTWRQFQRLYSQLGIPGKLTQWPCREIARSHSDALHDLWFDQTK